MFSIILHSRHKDWQLPGESSGVSSLYNLPLVHIAPKQLYSAAASESVGGTEVHLQRSFAEFRNDANGEL
ncbi:MAG: hypothetical protein ABIF19_05165 [Planctomycetota bacterium]